MKLPVNVLIGCVVVLCGGRVRPSSETDSRKQPSTAVDGGVADAILIESDAAFDVFWPGQCPGPILEQELVLPAGLPAPIASVTANNGCHAAVETPTPSAGETIVVAPPVGP